MKKRSVESWTLRQYFEKSSSDMNVEAKQESTTSQPTLIRGPFSTAFNDTGYRIKTSFGKKKLN